VACHRVRMRLNLFFSSSGCVELHLFPSFCWLSLLSPHSLRLFSDWEPCIPLSFDFDHSSFQNSNAVCVRGVGFWFPLMGLCFLQLDSCPLFRLPSHVFEISFQVSFVLPTSKTEPFLPRFYFPFARLLLSRSSLPSSFLNESLETQGFVVVGVVCGVPERWSRHPFFLPPLPGYLFFCGLNTFGFFRFIPAPQILASLSRDLQVRPLFYFLFPSPMYVSGSASYGYSFCSR